MDLGFRVLDLGFFLSVVAAFLSPTSVEEYTIGRHFACQQECLRGHVVLDRPTDIPTGFRVWGLGFRV